ncbi:g4876 [Coccomyxa elongata]
MGYLMQMLAVKLGVATGLSLAQQCRKVYPVFPRYILWIMMEIAIIGSDIQEVVGSAIAVSLLTYGAVPLWAGVLITAVASFLLLLLERLGVRHLEALFAVLIGVMAVAFGVMYVLAGVPTADVIEGLLIPRLPRPALKMAVAIVGAGIMPANFYLHSALVHSRKIESGQNARKKEALAYYRIESGIALFCALLINICVVAVFARGFYGTEGIEIGLENAGAYLGDTFGPLMRIIWAIGLLAAGQSSTITGVYTGQFVMSGFLDLRISQWKRISITRSVALVPTLLVSLLYRQPGGTELDILNEWLNVLQSVQIPFALLPLLMLTSSEAVMGSCFANRVSMKAAAWAIAAAILAINGSLLYDFGVKELPTHWAARMGFLAAVLFYVGLVVYFAVGPHRFAALSRRLREWRKKEPMSGESQLLLSGSAQQENGGGSIPV